MSNFAPPLSRDGFVYQGQLFADVGNLNRHPRASEAELTALLRPSKSLKDAPQKDQVGHWYVAQLKHYGLPPTKDKNAAKVRLLDALNSKKLKVPPDVKKLEATLKKEYDAANRKAKAALKGKPSESEATTPARKRKRGEDDGAPTSAATPAPSKKTKTPASTSAAKPKTTKPKANSSTAPGPQKKSNAAPKPKKATYASKKGTYLLSVPVVVSQWPTLAAMPKSLKILLCPDGEKLWGSFSFGPFSGVFLFDQDQSGDTFKFIWRGTDTSDPDQVRFTTGHGDMRFLDDKRIDGTFYNLYDYRCAFEGKLQGGVRQCPRDALSFEHEWDDYGSNNDWFGRPPIKIPPGERPPGGRQTARSSALSALKSAETRYLPNEDAQETTRKPSAEKSTKTLKKGATNKQPAKEESRLQQRETQSTPAKGTASRASIIEREDDFYSNSPSAMTPVYNSVDISQITGVYDIQCPAIEDNFMDSQNNLKLLLCRETRSSRTWGAFNFPPFFGVLQMNPGPADYSSVCVTLGWRARDVESTAVRFGRGCNGSMEFPEPGILQGRLFGLYGDIVEFWGRRRPGPKNCGHGPNKFEEEWNSFPSEVYGERRGSESDGELYDRNGNLNPRGRYSDLFERTWKS
ncbi:hypothetical protein SLS57_005629 [Botryosphaeria dothidea]